ncbi:LLM class flavin-dependent oxidoreductase [Paenibacillus sp. GYB003]|uniref:LLM class flavin-dependent oxidoreductase n=1 Tax=Paenibacillus sp. GYB003 TaxID=2994392 RepID=UPI002F96D2E9
MSHRSGQMHLTVALQGAGYHPGSWRHPRAEADRLVDPSYYYKLAQTAERGKLDLLFLDLTAVGERQRLAGSEPGLLLEPFTLLGALASVTEHIGLGAAVSTSVIEPFAVARQLSALDHLSGGRLAWLAGTAVDLEPRRLRGGPPELSRPEKLARLQEFLQVTARLWDSWEDGAVIIDRASGRYIDADKVHLIRHAGNYFRVRGPLSIPRSPQGHPVRIGLYGGDDRPDDTDVDTSELVFASTRSLEESVDFYKTFQTRIAGKGRSPDSAKVLAVVTPILGSTEAEARSRAAELAELAMPEGGKAAEPGRAQPFVGTPEQLADRLEAWFLAYGSDGFHIQPALLPGGLEELVDQVVPLLRRKGLFREQYEEAALRDRLGLRVPRGRPTREEVRL